MKTAVDRKGVKGAIIIDREACKGCLYCVEACPKKAISPDEHFNMSGYYPIRFIHPDRCTGCGLCAVVCPDIAIEVLRDKA